ncbi:LLM class flavin-dependent oxidoreductase [Amycolatopsis circi]|uniref:LLM class flavin-dependent oxidoreductase n=1 Tax=Amycolatopsis circi TaxID=871959 RepID=UPI000E24120F|nr:LLM class flavin-dependent oxidoreductase [Amycolatopsis circi]
MKFGINLAPNVTPEERSGAQLFAEFLELAELAEALGFDHVKTVEHYFTSYGGYSPDPVTFLAAVAARTERIRLVTGAVLPAFTHPLKLAGKLAMLDNISKGRLDVGFGRAFLPDEFEAFQVSMDESRARFEEGVEACRRLWAEEHVVWDGQFCQFGPVTMLPRPFQQPHPPILVATARTPESAEAAGRAGHGVMMVPSINKVEKVQDMLALYRKAYAGAGHEGEGQVHMTYNTYLSEDPERARMLGKKYADNTHDKLVGAVTSWATTRSEQYRGYEQIAQKAKSSSFEDQIRETKVLVGTPDEVVGQVRQIREWFGEITVSLQPTAGNMPVAESARTMELFAEHVLPRFA